MNFEESINEEKEKGKYDSDDVEMVNHSLVEHVQGLNGYYVQDKQEEEILEQFLLLDLSFNIWVEGKLNSQYYPQRRSAPLCHSTARSCGLFTKYDSTPTNPNGCVVSLSIENIDQQSVIKAVYVIGTQRDLVNVLPQLLWSSNNC